MKTLEVTEKQAKQLKKLGIGIGSDDNLSNIVAIAIKFLWKPPLDYACMWLRENFNIHVTPHPTYNIYGVIYTCIVFYIHKERVYNEMLMDEKITIDFTPPQIFDTYELAQSAGLDYALKVISKSKIKIITKEEKEKQKKEEKIRLDKSIESTKKLFKTKNQKK